MSDGNRVGGTVDIGWVFGFSPGFSGWSPGKVSGLQVALDSSNSSSACPFLLVDS